ncbi:MAG: glycosyltransferase family 2 protein [Paludibacteraceae bacterium]
MIIYDKDKFVKDPLVSINVLTYNQEGFIKETLDSILNQECDFEYEIIVGEDCSIDATRDICIEYQHQFPERIKLVLAEENGGLMVNFVNVCREYRGKYVAGIAGDDYWCDTKKLQKQVDFLEANPEYGVCFTACWLQYEDGHREFHPKSYVPCENGDVRHLAMYGPLGPAGTQMVRRELFQYINWEEIIKADVYSEDYITNAIWALYTKFAFLDDVTHVWRVVKNSISRGGTMRYQLGVLNIQKYLLYKYPHEYPFDRDTLQDKETYIRLKFAIKEGDYKAAKKYKHKIKTQEYRKKKLYKYFYGRITFCLLRKLYG